MKKPVCMFLILLYIVVMMAACKPSNPALQEPDVSSSSTPSTSSTAPTPDTPELPKYVPGSIELQDRRYDDYSFERPYRIMYYRIPGEFWDVLSDEEEDRFYEWTEEVVEARDPAEQNEMLLVSFVKEFHVSREDFERAADQFRKHNEGATHTEEWEVPNADIIYTFDNEIINEYYRYE